MGEELRARADSGGRYAAHTLANLLEHQGDIGGLRALADSGYPGVDTRLTSLPTALIASLPTLIQEGECHQPAPDDPHCDLLVDLTDW
ncbi:hypothetical protein AB0C13_38400 [Streptomyces sp. NPDC049099]|uniref:hypothetical protein n=1 Tax=Streptomyces sp. NPDC049099 TaxID=3155768 RepID=UPI0034298093